MRDKGRVILLPKSSNTRADAGQDCNERKQTLLAFHSLFYEGLSRVRLDVDSIFLRILHSIKFFIGKRVVVDMLNRIFFYVQHDWQRSEGEMRSPAGSAETKTLRW